MLFVADTGSKYPAIATSSQQIECGLAIAPTLSTSPLSQYILVTSLNLPKHRILQASNKRTGKCVEGSN